MKKYSTKIASSASGILGFLLIANFILSPLGAYSAAVASVAIMSVNTTIAVGSTQQFIAIAYDATGAMADPQPVFTWSSSNTAAGTISGTGLFTAVGAGTTIVTAQSGAINSTVTMNVVAAGAPIFTSINLSPLNTSITLGATYQMSALALYGAGQPVSPQPVFTWTSSNPGIATIDANGLFTAAALGQTTITASNSGISGTILMTVSAAPVPVLTSISVNPRTSNSEVGMTTQFSATAYDSLSINPANPQPVFTWTSSNNAVGTISATGLFTAVGAGSATITAQSGTISGTATISVVPVGGPLFSIISVSGTNGGFGTNVPLGYTVQLSATAWDASGFNMVNPQPVFTWTSSNPAVATVDAAGLFKAVGFGPVTITASSQGISGTKTTIVGEGKIITSSASANGAISPLGATTITPGANQTYAITPNTGYNVADVLVDSVSIGAVTSYTFINVQAAHTISATFAPTPAALPNLVVGWNLVGWNNNATNAETIGVANTGVNLVAKWDAVNQLWVSHIIGFPLNNFAVNAGDGIFVHKN